MKPVWLELWLWRREIARMRKDLARIEADLDTLSRSDSSPEAEALLAKYRSELPLTRHRITQLEEKLEAIAQNSPPLLSPETLTWLAFALGILLLILLAIVYGVPTPFLK